MANAVKSLADGQFAATKTPIYTAPGGTASVAKVKGFNTSAVNTETVELWITRGAGGSRETQIIELQPKWFFEADDIFLSAGDSIEGLATDAATVDYVVLGMAQT